MLSINKWDVWMVCWSVWTFSWILRKPLIPHHHYVYLIYYGRRKEYRYTWLCSPNIWKWWQIMIEHSAWRLTCSHDSAIHFSEPQSSVSGPTVVLLYVNSLCKHLLPYCAALQNSIIHTVFLINEKHLLQLSSYCSCSTVSRPNKIKYLGYQCRLLTTLSIGSTT